ncbi:MAG: hypothetical protein D6702_02585 [Planctomycetota bacterium]|nr:MAG: hypothetical protein D6702_02585 [Planctomycetota bacterium]
MTALASLCLLLALAPPAQDPASGRQPGELLLRIRLRAIVNDQILTDEDVYWKARRDFQVPPGVEPTQEQMDQAFPSALVELFLREGWRLSGRDEAMLDRIVQRELDARIEQAGSLAALSAEMSANGGSIEEFKRYFRRMVVGWLFRSIELGQQPEKGDAVKVAVVVAPREIREYYDNHKDLYSSPRRARGRILMIPKGADPEASRAQIEEIRARIAAGESTFVEEVEAHSSYRRSTGGDSGWITPNMSRAQALKDFFLGSPAGTLSEPLELAADWALCLVETVEEGGVAPFSEVQDEIRDKLLEQRYQEIMERAVRRIRRRCYVWPAEEVDAALERLFANAADGAPDTL